MRAADSRAADSRAAGSNAITQAVVNESRAERVTPDEVVPQPGQQGESGASHHKAINSNFGITNMADRHRGDGGDPSSKFKGVSWNKMHRRWQVTITTFGKERFLGYYFGA